MTPAQHAIDGLTPEALARARARLADDLLQAAVVITHADAGHVQLRETGRPNVRTVAQTGLPRSFGAVVDGDPSARALWRRVLELRRRIVVPDLFEARQLSSTTEDALRAVGLHATQASPIVSSAGTVVGVLSTHARLARTFTADELAKLDALLARAADFVEQAPEPDHLGDAALRHLRLDLRVAVGEAVDALTPVIRAHGHELTVCLGADPAWIAGDHCKLVSVFSSLLWNAVTHTPPGGRLAVFVHVGPGVAAVHVSDNGDGIPRKALGWIFTRRRGTMERPRPANDLTLAEAQRLVETLGGDLIPHSDGPGQGSRFVVRLPSVPVDRSSRRG